jgi:DNA-binding NtrC family response regulator
VSINCAAIPETLAESQLFGAERGAFSGAGTARAGLLESASGGTVFLDEIGDLPAAIQPKLLRALESQRVTRLGAVTEREIDVRVVTATHRDLATAARDGAFREDLFYRLSAAVIRVPPLRERQQELPLLARHFAREAAVAHQRPVRELEADALARLAAHPWPGNVRELRTLIGYLVAVFDGPLTGDKVAEAIDRRAARGAPAVSPTTARPSFRESKSELERREIEKALIAAGGNKTRAAAGLGMPLRTLMWKLKRYRAKSDE